MLRFIRYSYEQIPVKALLLGLILAWGVQVATSFYVPSSVADWEDVVSLLADSERQMKPRLDEIEQNIRDLKRDVQDLDRPLTATEDRLRDAEISVLRSELGVIRSDLDAVESRLRWSEISGR